MQQEDYKVDFLRFFSEKKEHKTCSLEWNDEFFWRIFLMIDFLMLNQAESRNKICSFSSFNRSVGG